MPRIPTPEQDARRDRAFELHQAGVSLRKISKMLGATLSTVQWWRDKDDWAGRAAAQMPTDSAGIRELLRAGFREALQELERILLTTEDEAVRVRAALAFATMCKDFGIRPQQSTPTVPAMLGFNDDLPMPPTSQASLHQPTSMEDVEAASGANEGRN
jgi:transposase